MSIEMNRVKEIIEEIIYELKASKNRSEEELILQLETIQRLVAQNQTKIWLRTRSGKPMAEALITVANNSLKKIKREGTPEEISIWINQIESKIKEIDEESQRRSMIVT